MGETVEFSITRASQLTIPNKDWTHYRSGLKLRCLNGSLGVSISVISQGKSIDSTMVTATNVRFLAKEPIVGLKIFDGEKLRKRVQVTFSSEGNFNMFANKIKQWLGIVVFANYETSDSPLAHSQNTLAVDSQPHREIAIPLRLSSQNNTKVEYTSQLGVSQTLGSQVPPSSNYASQNARSDAHSSQVAPSQEIMSQFVPMAGFSQQSNLSQVGSLQRRDDENTWSPSVRKVGPENYSCNMDAISMLLNAAANEKNEKSLLNCDTSVLSQSTQIWDNNEKNTFEYPSASANHLRYVQAAQEPQVTQPTTGVNSTICIPQIDLTSSLRNIPFNPNRRGKRSHAISSKKKSGMSELLESTIARILEEKEVKYANLSDQDLSLRICRRLKSRDFLMLLKRVENLLN